MEEFKNLKEIIELCKDELENNDENTHATLDLVDLKELENLINKNKELEMIIKLMTKDITLGIFDESMCRAMVDDDFWCKSRENDKCEKCTLEYYKKKAKGE